MEILKSARTRIKSATDSLRGSGEPRMVLQIPIFLHQFWFEQIQWKCGDCFATNMKVISLICIVTRREKARSMVGGPEAALESGFGGWGEGRRGNAKEEGGAWGGAEGRDLCAGKNKQVDALLLLMLLFLPGGLLQKGRIIQKRRISEKGRLLSQQSGRSESYREGPRRTGEGCQYFKASQ